MKEGGGEERGDGQVTPRPERAERKELKENAGKDLVAP